MRTRTTNIDFGRRYGFMRFLEVLSPVGVLKRAGVSARFITIKALSMIHRPREPLFNVRKRSFLLGLCAVGLLLGSGGVIIVISTNAVSNNGLSNFRWEPTSGSGSNWATGWTEIGALRKNWVGSWNSGTASWGPSIDLTPPNGFESGDLVLNWDASRNRFVFVMIDIPPGGANRNIWYGFSNDAAGTSWTFRTSPVLSR